MTQFEPFKDEAFVLRLDELTVENRLDRVEFYGSLQITRDKVGLALARELKVLLEATVAALEKDALPGKIEIKPAEKVRNPFK